MSDKSEQRMLISVVVLIFFLILSVVWMISAVRVDINSTLYSGEVSLAADQCRSIGTAGDKLQAKRTDMQNADFLALRLAANIPFILRLFITCLFVLGDYFLLCNFLRNLNLLLKEIDKESKKNSKRTR